MLLPSHRWLTAAFVCSQSDLGMTGIAWGVGDPVSDGEGSRGKETGTAAADLSGDRCTQDRTADDSSRPGPNSGGLVVREQSAFGCRPAAAVAAETERRDSHPPPAENRSERTKRPSSSNARTEQHTPATQKPSPSSAERTNPAPPAQPARPTRQTPAPQPSRSPQTDQSSSTAQRYQTTSAERRRRRRRISHALFGRRRGQQAAGTAEGSPCLEAESPEEGLRSPALRRRRAAAATTTATVGATADAVSAATTAAAAVVAFPSTSVAPTTGATSPASAVTAAANSGVTESTPRPANILRLTPGVTPAPARPSTQFITPAPPPALVITPVPTPDSAGRSRLSSGLNLSSQSNTDLFDSFEIGSRSALALGSTGKKATPRQSSAARSDRSGAVSADKTGSFIYQANSEEIDFGFDETKSTKKISIPYDQIASANKNDCSFKSARDSFGSNLVTSAMFEDAFTVEQLNLDELSFKENISPARRAKGLRTPGAPQSTGGAEARLSSSSGVRRSARLLSRSRASTGSPAYQQSPAATVSVPPTSPVSEPGPPVKRPSTSPVSEPSRPVKRPSSSPVSEPSRPVKRPSTSPLFDEERRASKRVSPAGPSPGPTKPICVPRPGLTSARPSTTPANWGHLSSSLATARHPAEPPAPHTARQMLSRVSEPNTDSDPAVAVWPEVCEISGPGGDWTRLKEASLHRWKSVCLAMAVEKAPSRTGEVSTLPVGGEGRGEVGGRREAPSSGGGDREGRDDTSELFMEWPWMRTGRGVIHWRRRRGIALPPEEGVKRLPNWGHCFADSE